MVRLILLYLTTAGRFPVALILFFQIDRRLNVRILIGTALLPRPYNVYLRVRPQRNEHTFLAIEILKKIKTWAQQFSHTHSLPPRYETRDL